MKSIAVVLLLLVAGAYARHINEAGLSLIKSFEGFRANFYNDAVVSDCLGIEGITLVTLLPLSNQS